MTTFTILVRGHGKVWTWAGVTESEMQRLCVAMGATPDGVDTAGTMFVEFQKGRARGDLPNLSLRGGPGGEQRQGLTRLHARESRLSLGTFKTINAEGAISVPTSETTALRVSVLNQTRDDWVENTYPGPNDGFEGYDESAGRVQFLYEGDDFEALLNAHARHLSLPHSPESRGADNGAGNGRLTGRAWKIRPQSRKPPAPPPLPTR